MIDQLQNSVPRELEDESVRKKVKTHVLIQKERLMKK